MLLTACSVPQVQTGQTTTPTAVAATSSASVRPSASAAPTPTSTVAADPAPRSFARLALDAGAHDGTVTSDLRLQLGASPAKGSYLDPYGRTISDERGTWTSSAVRPPFDFDQLVASWNATTPSGTW